MTHSSDNLPIPRLVPEGTVPLLDFEGTAYDCGKNYGETVLKKYPGYRRYLDPAFSWNRDLSGDAKRLFERHAPHIPEIFHGIADAAGKPDTEDRPAGGPAAGTRSGGDPSGGDPSGGSGCTSFGVSGKLTLDGQPLSGQTKDTVLQSAELYTVLRMKIDEAPGILTVAYPGEVLGYGLWSTGMSLFRNSLHSTAGCKKGLTMVQWGLLALSAASVHDAAELAVKQGMRGAGNFLISDSEGESLSVEFNVGGVGVVRAKAGIATHANHPEGPETAPYEKFPDEGERENSRYRMHGLWNLLYKERGRLTPQKALHALADHTHYPMGICRHMVKGSTEWGTTAAVAAEPTMGRLHVVRSNPCCNWPVTYTL